MSVQAMAWTIDHSRHKGGSLLVLLMIANHAKSDGSGAWPSTTTLATECRMSERQVRRIIDEVLEPSAELAVVRRTGRPHLYDLPLVRSTSTPVKMSGVAVPEMSDPPRTISQQPRTLPPVTPDIAMSDEPKQPKQPSKQPSKATRAREPDPIWDTLVACFGAAPIEEAFRGAWNRVAKELRGQGATPEEIVLRVARYKASMPTVECTPTALAKHWGRLARDAPASRRVSKIEAARAERRMSNGQAEGRGDHGNREGGMVLGDGTRDVRHLDGGGL